MHARSIFTATASILGLSAAFALTACAGDDAATGETTAAASSAATQAAPETTMADATDAGAALDAALAGDHRSEENRARDAWRHPKETLQFFGVEPDMTVVEIWPGGGWYTEVIAPYLKTGGGVFYGAGFPSDSSERAAAANAAYKEKFVDNPDVYGEVRMSVLPTEDGIAPAGTADVVLTFRNVHNWLGGGAAPQYFADFYAALKPGGVLGVVEHRANEEGDPNGGYVKESTVIELATAAGFELEERSEINANPADTKDHPFGVWTLPPVRRSSAARGLEDEAFDRAKYDAIGESDRMTLKFRKPIAADGALLE